MGTRNINCKVCRQQALSVPEAFTGWVAQSQFVCQNCASTYKLNALWFSQTSFLRFLGREIPKYAVVTLGGALILYPLLYLPVYFIRAITTFGYPLRLVERGNK